MFSAKTTGSYVNIRASASTSSDIVGKINTKGTSITVTPDTDHLDWMGVQYGSISGYISSQYVEVLDGNGDCYVNITKGVLNIRQTPSTKAKILYTKNKDEAMCYVGSYNGWKCVSCSDGTGWASGEYIFVPA